MGNSEGSKGGGKLQFFEDDTTDTTYKEFKG